MAKQDNVSVSGDVTLIGKGTRVDVDVKNQGQNFGGQGGVSADSYGWKGGHLTGVCKNESTKFEPTIKRLNTHYPISSGACFGMENRYNLLKSGNVTLIGKEARVVVDVTNQDESFRGQGGVFVDSNGGRRGHLTGYCFKTTTKDMMKVQHGDATMKVGPTCIIHDQPVPWINQPPPPPDPPNPNFHKLNFKF